MAKRITISPDQVRSVASQFKAKGNESDGMVQQLSSAVRSLESQWEGMAAQKFKSEFETWAVDMKKYATLLNDIGLQLDKIANTLETTDQQLASGR
jgi:WXG100 family type VII secretion target